MKLQRLVASLVALIQAIINVITFFRKPKSCAPELADDDMHDLPSSDDLPDSLAQVSDYLQQFEEALPPLDIPGDLDLSDAPDVPDTPKHADL